MCNKMGIMENKTKMGINPIFVDAIVHDGLALHFTPSLRVAS